MLINRFEITKLK